MSNGGAVTTYTYNDRGQLAQIRDALGQVESFTYDANGLTIMRTDRNGTQFRMTYDHMGRLVLEEALQGGVVTGWHTWDYNPTGSLHRLATGGHEILYIYDAQGRVIRQEETGGIVKTFAYNAANNLTQARTYINGGLQVNNTYTFDTAQRVLTVRSNNELMSTYAYDANGNRIRMTLANGVVSEYTFNLANLVTTMTNRQGTTVLSSFEYSYYLDGNVSQIVECERIISYTYDLARRLIREEVTATNALVTALRINESGSVQRGSSRQLSVTVDGLLSPPQSANWSVSGNSSDITRISESGLLSVAANETSRSLTITARSQQTPSIFDSIELMVTVDSSEAMSVSPIKASVIPGESLQFSAVGVVEGNVIWSVEGNAVSDTTIDSTGLLTVSCCESNILTIRARTADMDATATAVVLWGDHCSMCNGEMVRISNGWVCSVSMCCHLCGDPKAEMYGDIICIACLGEFSDISFDNVTQPLVAEIVEATELSAAIAPASEVISETREYTFDSRGNRATMVVSGLQNYTVTYTYDLNNRLTREVRTGDEPHTNTFTYDRNGNQLTTQRDGSQAETRTYDAFNRLIRVTEPGVTLGSYTYRADGLRHSKTTPGIATRYHVWNGMHIVAERNTNGAVVDRFTRSLSGRLITSHRHGFYIFNIRGDVVQLADATGVVIRTYVYDAFGNERNQDPNDTNPFRFAGEYWDFETNTYYLRARNFSPRLGRFTQPDPFWNIHNMQSSTAAILQSANLFVFCINNPVRWIDPSGLRIELSGTEEERQQLLGYLQTLTDHQLSADANGIVSISRRETRSGYMLFLYGNTLIERTIASSHTVTINLVTDHDSAFGAICWENASTAGVGSGGVIRLRTGHDHTAITLDSAGLAVITDAPLNLVLAHELIHADRAMRGAIIPLNQLGTTSFETARVALSPARIFGNTTRTVTHTFHLEEMATIGISHYTSRCITENMIRSEHGLGRRVSHFSRIG